MMIRDILKNKKPSISFEFFPPKSPDLETLLFETIDSLKGEKADFASVTFGAGGSFAGKTIDWTKQIKNTCNITTMMHITCVGFFPKDVDQILDVLKLEGINNVLALRGDTPKDAPSDLRPYFSHASDLVAYIARRNEFSIGVAGYPEKHPEASDLKTDMENLKIKVDKGADFIITQLFFDNKAMYKFRDKLYSMSVDKPIIAGIMPIVNAAQVIRFTKMCGSVIPQKLLNSIEGKGDDEVMKIGVDYAVAQCEDLIKNGVNGLHFYTLNRSAATKNVLKQLK